MNKITMNEHQRSGFHFNGNKVILVIRWGGLVKVNAFIISQKSSHKAIWNLYIFLTLKYHKSIQEILKKIKKKIRTFVGPGNCP